MAGFRAHLLHIFCQTANGERLISDVALMSQQMRMYVYLLGGKHFNVYVTWVCFWSTEKSRVRTKLDINVLKAQ